MAIDQWCWSFFKRHTERVHREDWPEPESGFWEAWRHALVTHGITEAVADAASLDVSLAPPQYLSQQRDAFFAASKARFKSAAGGSAPPDDRAAAGRLSRDCPGCGGSGYGHVVDARRSEALGYEVRFACLCPAGCPMARWLEHKLSQGEPETLRRLRAAARYGDAEAETGEEFDAAALARWRDTPESDRESWRALIAERAPWFARSPVNRELMSIAWCHDPGLVIAAAPPRRPAGARGPRQVMGGPLPGAASRSVLVPTPDPEPEATTVAVAAPGPAVDPDEEF